MAKHSNATLGWTVGIVGGLALLSGYAAMRSVCKVATFDPQFPKSPFEANRAARTRRTY